MNVKLSFTAMLLLFLFGLQAQKTYFINTEREGQQLLIGSVEWNGDAFFTMEEGGHYHQVIVSEPGFKKEFDILHENLSADFTTYQALNIDTSIISIIKPIDLSFVEQDFDFRYHELDYATFSKDLDHDGDLRDYHVSEKDGEIINKVKPSNQYLINGLNDYHNMTVGRYKFYTLGNITSLDIYRISLNERDKFIYAKVTTDWSITKKNTENLPQYSFEGESGKIMISGNEVADDEINMAVNDALMSSLLYFISSMQEKLIQNMN